LCVAATLSQHTEITHFEATAGLYRILERPTIFKLLITLDEPRIVQIDFGTFVIFSV